MASSLAAASAVTKQLPAASICNPRDQDLRSMVHARMGQRTRVAGKLTQSTASTLAQCAGGRWEEVWPATSSIDEARFIWRRGCGTTSRHENGRTWKQCQKDGERWSATLWKEGKTGPAELSKKAAKQSRPPVDRSDPGRNKRDGPGPDNGPGSGPPAGPGAASSGSGGDLLLKMWQATVRELK